MVTVGEVYRTLCDIAPVDLAESWDNVGFLVGRKDAAVNRILAALDITPEVIDEAIKAGADLIVSHHPLIWDTHKFVNDTVFQQEKVLTLAENHISAICMHTNLDKAPGGVDDTLAMTLGLSPVAVLGSDGIGRISMLNQPMELIQFLNLVGTKLHANGLRYVSAGKPVQRVGTGCGSCGSYLRDAVEKGCDTFVTGDIKHDVWLDAKGLKINLIDAGHFSTENPVTNVLVQKLAECYPELDVRLSAVNVQPEQFYFPEY